MEANHRAEPIADSFYTKLGKPANLFRTQDYPIEAVCQTCSKPIVAESFLKEFRHFDRE
jgi:hypothetical protein